MPGMMPDKVANIISDAGGKVVGRTRLQKIAYLLDVAGYSDGFHFKYKHYGPYSEDLASSAMLGAILGSLNEAEHQATWGGNYSIFSAVGEGACEAPVGRRQLASTAALADSIELELAATAVFLSQEGYGDPWAETERRKPEKVVGGRLEKAKSLLTRLREIDVPRPLPDIG